jgi:hypothetical protein
MPRLRRNPLFSPRIIRACGIAVLLAAGPCLRAWNKTGHQAVAFIAYHELGSRAKARIDLLLPFHPDYARWVAEVPVARRPLQAFLDAAVWADEIKQDPLYRDEPLDRDEPRSRHPVYPDHLRHRNWHYIDAPLAGAFGALAVDASEKGWRNPPNAVSQIRLMESILRGEDRPGAERAWALAWLIHLTGDLHQPLHCASRMHDQGGNRVLLRGRWKNLHELWDDALGTDSSPAAVESLGMNLIRAAEAEEIVPVKRTNPGDWVEEGTLLSIHFVYPGLAGAPGPDGAISVPPAYRRVAAEIAARRVTLAGFRLAALLNRIF